MCDEYSRIRYLMTRPFCSDVEVEISPILISVPEVVSICWPVQSYFKSSLLFLRYCSVRLTHHELKHSQSLELSCMDLAARSIQESSRLHSSPFHRFGCV